MSIESQLKKKLRQPKPDRPLLHYTLYLVITLVLAYLVYKNSFGLGDDASMLVQRLTEVGNSIARSSSGQGTPFFVGYIIVGTVALVSLIFTFIRHRK